MQRCVGKIKTKKKLVNNWLNHCATVTYLHYIISAFVSDSKIVSRSSITAMPHMQNTMFSTKKQNYY